MHGYNKSILQEKFEGTTLPEKLGYLQKRMEKVSISFLHFFLQISFCTYLFTVYQSLMINIFSDPKQLTLLLENQPIFDSIKILKITSSYLQHGGQYLAGNQLSWADLHFFQVLTGLNVPMVNLGLSIVRFISIPIFICKHRFKCTNGIHRNNHTFIHF